MQKVYYSIFSLLLLLMPFLSYGQDLSDITGVTLTFSPAGGGADVVATATDPDGDGAMMFQTSGSIDLLESGDYDLAITIDINSADGTSQITGNAEDFLFFFGFDDELFTSPAGDGNIDNRADPINYDDTDSNGQPIGLATSWETECGEATASGSFRVVLKNQQGIKSGTSTADDGVTEFDITWDMNINEDPDAPPCENEEEIITDVTLTFTPVGGGTAIVATAQDPDGEGPLPLVVQGAIDLDQNVEYEMSITLFNSIEDEDITMEIMEEDDEHMFFFGFTDEVFLSPAGDGNIDNRDDPVNYNDFDENGLPVGLSTNWETDCGEDTNSGTFRVVLKHQPGVKSSTSTVNDGSTDVDLTWDVNAIPDPDAPPCENEEEIITDVTLTFTPVGGGTAIVASAQDPDGEGPLPLTVQGAIDLDQNVEYEMSITLFNSIEDEDITMEIMEEDDEHMFFFGFTDEVFLSPAGDGNIDNRDDPVNYNDFDENGLPVGLSTNWETDCGDGTNSGTFRVVLKHQPGVKSATSTVDDGSTDVDLTWDVNAIPDPDAPPCENEEEIITDVTLTWTPVGGGDVVTATAQDPDGEGPLPLVVQGAIDLDQNVEYEMSITLFNSIEDEDITTEIMEEDDEHMFFFSFTDEVFLSPAGDGNTDNRDDPVDYNDFDENNLPVGLSTQWETDCGEGTISGTFRVVLKHQPGVKSETSTVDDGSTDVDLTWDVNAIPDPDAPPCENEEEIITDVTLTFTPEGGGDPIIATAQDPDGEGPLPLEVTQDIFIEPGVDYEMSITLFNSIEDEDITEEIMEEDDEHMFFFGWTNDVFADPTGDGNIDNRPDPVRYNDMDENMLPVGLSTQWETVSDFISGTFRVVLKHQPDIKSETSTADDGSTDVDLTWNINLVTSTNDPEIQDGGLSIWPNPARESINWQVEGLTPNNQVLIRLFDPAGRLMKVLNTNDQQIDLSGLGQGMYQLQVVADDKTWIERFILTK